MRPIRVARGEVPESLECRPHRRFIHRITLPRLYTLPACGHYTIEPQEYAPVRRDTPARANQKAGDCSPASIAVATIDYRLATIDLVAAAPAAPAATAIAAAHLAVAIR